jgi:hypothetical protein
MSRYARWFLLILLVGPLAGAACDEGAKAGASAEVAVDVSVDLALPDAITGGPDDAAGGADAGPVGPPTLDFAAAVGDDGENCRGAGFCAVSLKAGETRRLEVVTSEGGVPVDERVVTFKIEGDEAAIGQISRLSTYSDPEGKAWVEVSAPGATVGQFNVRAQLDAADAAPVTFEILVTPDGRIPLTVWPSYAGELAVETVSVRAIAQATSGDSGCANPTGLLASPDPAGLAAGLTPGRPARLLSLPAASAGTAYTLLATGHDASGLAVVWGCDAASVVLNPTSSLAVDVTMGDRTPGFSGMFGATSELAFSDALAGAWASRTAAAFELLDGAAGELALWPCALAAEDPALAQLCALSFNDPTAPHPDDATALGAAVFGALSKNVEALRDGRPWGAALSAGGSVRDVITRLEVRSTLRFSSEPSPSGSWDAASASDVWEAVVARFGEAVPCDLAVDPGCGKKSLFFAMTQPDAPVGGAFSATVTQSLEVSVDSHPTGLRYGPMLNAVLERALLPALVGDGAGAGAVTRWEDLIALSLGGPGCLGKTGAAGCCGSFVASLGEAGTLAQGSLIGPCETWIAEAAAKLRAPLLDAGAGGGGFASVGTQTPCPAADDDGDLVVDRFGAADAPCAFELVVGDEAGTSVMPLAFHAVRTP